MMLVKRYLLLATGCFLLCACEETAGPKKTVRHSGLDKEEAKAVIINYSVGANRKAKITAPLMYRVLIPSEYTEFPKTIHVDFFGEKDTLESRLDAHYARYTAGQNLVYLRDSVRVINVKGDTLYCKELYWDRNRRGDEFFTNDSVRIRTKTHIIDGIGMDAGQDFKQWHIVHPIGFVKVPSSQFPD